MNTIVVLHVIFRGFPRTTRFIPNTDQIRGGGDTALAPQEILKNTGCLFIYGISF